MPKKTTQNQTHNQEPEILDEETDPMLRALQKKVRNINKKLNEISELAARKDLKPEQEEKISKKGQVVQEREKYQEMIEVYKEIASENIKIIRKTQLSELENLASIIAVREYGADLPSNFNQSVDNLVKILINPSRELTIQQRVVQITEALIKNANNEKLKAAVKTYIELNLERKINGDDLSNEAEAISPRSERERESEIRELVEEERKEIEHKVICKEPLTPQVISVSRNLENTVQTNSVVENQTIGEASTESVTHLNVEINNNKKNVVPKDGNANEERRKERNLREGRRGRGGRPYEDRRDKGEKKPTFKPKYEEKHPREKEHDSDASEDSEPKARDFKREEVKDLINDGFIIVGKPKPKARDQKQLDDFEHGKKFHPHNQKKHY